MPTPKRLGDAIGGDVVVGRADAAGGEEIGVAAAQGVDRGDDLLLHVRHDADLAQVDADPGQVLGDVADILVLGAAREDLIADDEKSGCDGNGHAQGSFSGPLAPETAILKRKQCSSHASSVSFPAGAQRRGRESITQRLIVDPLPGLRPPGMTS